MIDLMFLKENPEVAKSVRVEISGADLLALSKSLYELALADTKQTSKEEEVYLTPAQMAKTLQVSLVTLWSWDKKGITKPQRIGNAKRYRRSDIEKMLSPEA